jgi:hypothetical protein
MAVASNAVSMLSFGTTLNATKKAATSRTTVRKYQPKKAAITFSCVRIAVSQAPSVRRPCSQRPAGPLLARRCRERALQTVAVETSL